MSDPPPSERDVGGVEPWTDEFREGEKIAGTTYTVRRKLGRGGHATTYEVTNSIGKALALKVLHRDLAQNAEHTDRLIAEATRLASLDDVNIVEVYSAGVTGGPHPQAYIEMQLLNGKSLRQLPRRNGRLSSAVVVDLAIQICCALEAAHKKGIVHQDLKLENVVAHKDARTNDYVMKLLDFGVSRFVGDVASEGLFEGTPESAAPEQLSGDAPITPLVDLYALGVMMFELLTGRRPYYEAEQSDKAQAKVNLAEGKQSDLFTSYLFSAKLKVDAPRLSDVFKDSPFPQRLEDLVASLLARSPADRPQSATDVLVTLRSLKAALAKEQGDGTTQDALKRVDEPSTPPEDISDEPLRGGRSIRIQLPPKAAFDPSILAAADRNATLEMAPIGLDGNRTVRVSPVPYPRPSASPSASSPPAVAVSRPQDESPRRPSTPPPPTEGQKSTELSTIDIPRPVEPPPKPAAPPTEAAPRNTIRFGASPLEAEPPPARNQAIVAPPKVRPWVEDERAKFERIPPLDLAFDLFKKETDERYIAEVTGIPLERALFLGAWFRHTYTQWFTLRGGSQEQLDEHRRHTSGIQLACDLLATDASVEELAGVANIPFELADHIAHWFADAFHRWADQEPQPFQGDRDVG